MHLRNRPTKARSKMRETAKNGTATAPAAVEDVSKIESPSLQKDWEVWRQRLNDTNEQRIRFLSKVACKHSLPTLVKVSFVVTSEGQIRDIRFVEKSSKLLSVIVWQTVKSLDGDKKLLSFPEGSQRTRVSDTVTLRHNFDRVLVPTTDGSPYSIDKKHTE